MDEKKIFITILLFFLSVNFIYSTACIGIGGGGYKINAIQDKPVYLTFTIYNTDADPQTICDSGIYSLSLDIKNEDIAKIFKIKISENNFLLHDSQTKQVLVELLPIVKDGNYVVEVKARMSLENNDKGTSISPTANSQVLISVGNESTDKFSQEPEWYPLTKKNNIFLILIIFIPIIIIVLSFIIYFKFKQKKYY